MSLKRDHFNRKIHLGDVLVFRGITYTWTLQGVPNGSVTVTGCQFTIPLGLIGTPWKVVVVINISMRKWETQFIKRFHHRLYRSCNHAWNLRLTCLWDKIQWHKGDIFLILQPPLPFCSSTVTPTDQPVASGVDWRRSGGHGWKKLGYSALSPLDYTHVYMYIHRYRRMYIYIYIYMCLCIYVHIHVFFE